METSEINGNNEILDEIDSSLNGQGITMEASGYRE